MKTYEKTTIRISHIEEHSTLLGPYNRFLIWVHGCCFNCDGCLATNTRYGTYKNISINELSQMIIQSECEGITISGGEPFLQASELSALIENIRKIKDIGVIIYSGFTLSEIKDDPNKHNLLEQTDILIDGQYIKELDDGRPYIGSSNQKLHYLTNRYKEVGAQYYSTSKRQSEIKITPNEVVLIGVPTANVLNTWKSLKEKSGGNNNAI